MKSPWKARKNVLGYEGERKEVIVNNVSTPSTSNFSPFSWHPVTVPYVGSNRWWRRRSGGVHRKYLTLTLISQIVPVMPCKLFRVRFFRIFWDFFRVHTHVDWIARRTFGQWVLGKACSACPLRSTNLHRLRWTMRRSRCRPSRRWFHEILGISYCMDSVPLLSNTSAFLLFWFRTDLNLGRIRPTTMWCHTTMRYVHSFNHEAYTQLLPFSWHPVTVPYVGWIRGWIRGSLERRRRIEFEIKACALDISCLR